MRVSFSTKVISDWAYHLSRNNSAIDFTGRLCLHNMLVYDYVFLVKDLSLLPVFLNGFSAVSPLRDAIENGDPHEIFRLGTRGHLQLSS